MRSGLALILSDDPPNLAVDASLEVCLSCGPGAEVYLCWVSEITPIRTKKGPRDDGANVKFPGWSLWV